MNKRQQNKIEKILFKVYESGLKQVDCDLTTHAEEIEKELIIDDVSNSLINELKRRQTFIQTEPNGEVRETMIDNLLINL